MSNNVEDRLAALEKKAAAYDLLASKLKAIEDAEEIKRLMATYIRHLADREFEAFEDFFTSDCEVDIRYHGLKRGLNGVRELMVGELKGMVRSPDAYILSSPDVRVDGDRATGHWTWHRHICEYKGAAGQTVRVWGQWMEGRYKIDYRRNGGKWKIHKMWFRVVKPDVDPESEEMKRLPNGTYARRVRD
jgi:hypothetical protein